MTNLETALYLNNNIQAQSYNKPQGETFKFLNDAQDRIYKNNIINAIMQDNTKCSQNVHN